MVPDIEGQLDRATAALWLLDQVHNGELSLLTMGDSRLPCWVSTPAAESMRPRDVAGWIEDMGLKTLADALAAVKRLTHPTRRADR